MKIEVVRAWPRRCERVQLELPAGARITDALRASGMFTGGATVSEATAVAVFGVVTTLDAALHDGDRVELLRPLLIDPKQARRRRARAAKGPR